MSDTQQLGSPAQRLADYLEALAAAAGQSVRAYCAERGFDDARISRWKTSARDPQFSLMREFGDAFGLNLGQVMVIAGYGTPADFGDGAEPPEPVAPEPPDLDAALIGVGMRREDDRSHVHSLVESMLRTRLANGPPGGRGARKRRRNTD